VIALYKSSKKCEKCNGIPIMPKAHGGVTWQRHNLGRVDTYLRE
jgi:hypothetical protein